MDIWTVFSIVALAGMIHASFQLSVSSLTLLSGHTISREKSHLRLLKLSSALVFGAISMTIFLFCGLAFFAQIAFGAKTTNFIWMILIGILAGTGISVWLFYYKRSRQIPGTELWIPRSMAKFLNKRAKKTVHSAEAFSLGITSVLSELIFIFAPIFAAILATISLPNLWQFLSILIYTLIANLPLIIIFCLICGGHSIAEVQIWREKHKRFLQFCAGSGLIILAIFIYVFQILPNISGVIS